MSLIKDLKNKGFVETSNEPGDDRAVLVACTCTPDGYGFFGSQAHVMSVGELFFRSANNRWVIKVVESSTIVFDYTPSSRDFVFVHPTVLHQLPPIAPACETWKRRWTRIEGELFRATAIKLVGQYAVDTLSRTVGGQLTRLSLCKVCHEVILDRMPVRVGSSPWQEGSYLYDRDAARFEQFLGPRRCNCSPS